MAYFWAAILIYYTPFIDKLLCALVYNNLIEDSIMYKLPSIGMDDPYRCFAIAGEKFVSGFFCVWKIRGVIFSRCDHTANFLHREKTTSRTFHTANFSHREFFNREKATYVVFVGANQPILITPIFHSGGHLVVCSGRL